MQPQIIGISGSPIKHSNTDRLFQAVLDSSGLSTESGVYGLRIRRNLSHERVALDIR